MHGGLGNDADRVGLPWTADRSYDQPHLTLSQ